MTAPSQTATIEHGAIVLRKPAQAGTRWLVKLDLTIGNEIQKTRPCGQGDLASFAKLLHQGPWLHVGKNTSFGLGGYRLQAADAAQTPR